MGRVYLYAHDLRASGVVRNALAYARRLALQHETTLVAGYGQGLFSGVEVPGVRTVVLSTRSNPAVRLTAAYRLRRWLKSSPPGVVFSVGNFGHPTVYPATRCLTGFPRIYRISNAVERDNGSSPRRRAWIALLLRDAAQIVLVGGAQRNLPVFAAALRSGRAVEIPNGVDRAAILARAAEPAPHAWLQEPVPVILGIGRLHRQKNFPLLIEAVARARQVRRLRLVLLGPGTDRCRTKMRALAESAGLADDFLLAGETANVFPWLSRAAVFALPSRWEGSSMALLEALAVGTPVVAAAGAGDARHVLGDGRYGLLVEDTNPDLWAAALLRQVEDPVCPGDRADAFGLSVDAYAAVIDDVMAGLPA